MNITLEYLTEESSSQVRTIQRDDVSEDFVDSIDTICEIHQYGLEHHCIGINFNSLFNNF